jgi:YhcH/YjgK/YiaL family protein
MIIDRLNNASVYYPLGKRLAAALRYLQETNLVTLPPGDYEIDGKSVYAIIRESVTKPLDHGVWEGHRKYIDIHFVIEGAEQIGYAPIDSMKPGEYDSEKDFLPLKGDGTFFYAIPGTFIIMFPQDAHLPGIALDIPKPFKKAVMKIAVF